MLDVKPKCIIVTGRQGSGKSTLCRKLGEQLWMPVVSRDEIKEGYVSTFGVPHDELPPDANAKVTNLFFELVDRYLGGGISVVIEAAFQHHVWEPRISNLRQRANVFIVLCTVDDAVAGDRAIKRGLENPDRELYHGDHRVVHYKRTGELLTPASYDPPAFDLPTIIVSTDDGYSPSIDKIVASLRSNPTWEPDGPSHR